MFAESLVALVGLLSLQTAQPINTDGPFLNALPVARYVPAPSQPPSRKSMESLGVETTARSAAVLDVKSGEFLYEKDSNAAHPIASITKLVSAMVFLDSKPDLREVVTIQPEDDSHEGKAVLPTGEKLTKLDLLHALLIGSVNTAGNAIARTTGGTEAFVRAMNAKVRALGLPSASFVDPTGLDAHNVASAKDVSHILNAALMYSDIRDITKMDKIAFTGLATNKPYLIKSTNLLLDSFLNKGSYHVLAAKTGSLPEAGFCLAQATQNAFGNQIIAVVLGSATHLDRYEDVKALTYWTFQNYEWPSNGRYGFETQMDRP